MLPEAICFWRYNTGERIGYTRWGREMALDYGAPYYQIHRADYHTLLLASPAPRLASTSAWAPPFATCSLTRPSRAGLMSRSRPARSIESWSEEGSGDKMRADFADFEPR